MWDTQASDVLVIDKVLFLNLVAFYVFLKIIMKAKILATAVTTTKKPQTPRNKFNKKYSRPVSSSL